MIGVIKKEKNPEVESQKIIDNHLKAAMHHENAAMHHKEAAEHQIAGNNTMACGCDCKAKDQTKLALKAQKKNRKKQSKIT